MELADLFGNVLLALGKLPALSQHIVHLYFFEEETTVRIGIDLDLSASSVKQRIEAALLRVRRALWNTGDPFLQEALSVYRMDVYYTGGQRHSVGVYVSRKEADRAARRLRRGGFNAIVREVPP